MKKRTAGKTATVTIQRFALADLKDHVRNPRKHPDPGTPEWQALKASINNVYFDSLVANIRKGPCHMTLVSGHLRRKVLVELGYTHADVSVVDVDDAMHLAMMLAANKQQGTNDEPRMAEIMVDLQNIEGFDVQLTGFTVPEMTELCVDAGLMEAPKIVEDEAPVDRAKELQKKWGTKRGQVWGMGRFVWCPKCKKMHRVD